MPGVYDTEDDKLQIQDQENARSGEENGFRLLKSPLPAPPRRSHIRMEFDLTDSDEDDFDLEIADGDDFDI
jgi:hypothetical protein